MITMKMAKWLFSGDWHLRGGPGEKGAVSGAAGRVWGERTVFGWMFCGLPGALGTDRGKVEDTVAGLTWHFRVMLLIFVTDLPFHLLIKKTKKNKTKPKT